MYVIAYAHPTSSTEAAAPAKGRDKRREGGKGGGQRVWAKRRQREREHIDS